MGGVIAVIGARLNSSRLPGKHLLDLAGAPLIARIFERLERIAELDHIVLATTADDYNQPLVEWAQRAGKAVFVFEGDVNDVLGRVDAVVRQYDADMVVYVCGDSPLIDPGTVAKMIHALQQQPAAGYVRLAARLPGATPIHEGFYPYPIATWRKLVRCSTSPAEREHVGAALSKFINELDTVTVADAPEFSRLQHRISVDTPSDYRFMSEIYSRWYEGHDERQPVSLKWVIDLLLTEPRLRQINSEVRQRRVGEHAMKVLLMTQCGDRVGLGHLRRSVLLARALQDSCAAGVELLVIGAPVSNSGLELIPHMFVPDEAAIEASLPGLPYATGIDALVFDLAPAALPVNVGAMLTRLDNGGMVKIAVDGLFDYVDRLDLICVPSFYLAPQYRELAASGKVVFGWNKYFLPTVHGAAHGAAHFGLGRRVLVLTGGADVGGLGERWPVLLDRALPRDCQVIWVRGPYAAAPVLPAEPRLDWYCAHVSDDLAALMEQANFALSLYGVSLFELLQRGVPTVTLNLNTAQQDEMSALATENVAVVSHDEAEAVVKLAELIIDTPRAESMSKRARAKLATVDGAVWLAQKIESLVKGYSA